MRPSLSIEVLALLALCALLSRALKVESAPEFTIAGVRLGMSQHQVWMLRVDPEDAPTRMEFDSAGRVTIVEGDALAYDSRVLLSLAELEGILGEPDYWAPGTSVATCVYLRHNLRVHVWLDGSCYFYLGPQPPEFTSRTSPAKSQPTVREHELGFDNR